MKRLIFCMLCLTVSGALALPAMAQPRGGGGPGGPDGPRRGPMGPGDDDGPSGGMAGGMGMMGPGRPMPPQFQKLEMLRTYIDVVDRFTRLSRDPATAGVAAVVTASDLLRARGADAAIDYFNKILPDVKNETVQRAIHIQLADLYKQAGQADKALEQLEILLKGAPAGAAATGDTPAPR